MSGYNLLLCIYQPMPPNSHCNFFSRWVYYDSITESDAVGIHDTMRINDDGSLRIQGPILREKYRSQMLLGCRRAKSGMRSPILVNLTYEKGKNSRSKSEKPLFFEEGEKKNGKGFEKKRLLAYQIPYMKSQGICRK